MPRRYIANLYGPKDSSVILSMMELCLIYLIVRIELLRDINTLHSSK